MISSPAPYIASATSATCRCRSRRGLRRRREYATSCTSAWWKIRRRSPSPSRESEEPGRHEPIESGCNILARSSLLQKRPALADRSRKRFRRIAVSAREQIDSESCAGAPHRGRHRLGAPAALFARTLFRARSSPAATGSPRRRADRRPSVTDQRRQLFRCLQQAADQAPRSLPRQEARGRSSAEAGPGDLDQRRRAASGRRSDRGRGASARTAARSSRVSSAQELVDQCTSSTASTSGRLRQREERSGNAPRSATERSGSRAVTCSVTRSPEGGEKGAWWCRRRRPARRRRALFRRPRPSRAATVRAPRTASRPAQHLREAPASGPLDAEAPPPAPRPPCSDETS